MGKMSSKVKIHRNKVHFATTFRKLRNQIFVSYIDICYTAEQRHLSLSSELYIYKYIHTQEFRMRTLDWNLGREVSSENITNLWISEWGGWPQKGIKGDRARWSIWAGLQIGSTNSRQMFLRYQTRARWSGKDNRDLTLKDSLSWV